MGLILTLVVVVVVVNTVTKHLERLMQRSVKKTKGRSDTPGGNGGTILNT